MLDSLGAQIILEEQKFFRVMGKVTIEGKKEEVVFYPGVGWLTDEELFEMRQTDPRHAP